MQSMTTINELISEDYVHSSNSLFHFMSSPQYLIDALKRKALCPRYCTKDVEYLKISDGRDEFKKIGILQKCFCDIPLHNILKKFPVTLTDNNDLTEEQKQKLPKEFSHVDFYGKYALAFPKKWGEENRLQPVHYLSTQADGVFYFSRMLREMLEKEDLSDMLSDTVLNSLCYLKPLRGTMWRRWETEDNKKIEYEVFKNFHDEHEWRYVPYGVNINGDFLDCLIANNVIEAGLLNEMSNRLEDVYFKSA